MSDLLDPPGGLPKAPPVVVPVEEWLRLHPRTILVDLVRGGLGLVPFLVAITVFGVEAGSDQLFPLLVLAGITLFRAAGNVVRWIFTRYRITPTHVELRTGVLVRAHRSMQRDRIRSVDLEAKLRHRLAGLRMVKVGAGQHAVSRESALRLDAVSVADAAALRALLQPRGGSLDGAGDGDRAGHSDSADLPVPTGDPTDAPVDLVAEAEAEAEPVPVAGTVLARFRPSWFVYAMFSVWAYAMALGLGWGAYFLLQAFGVDVDGFISSLVERADLGTAGTAVVAVLLVGLFGSVGMAVNYFVEYWDFELSRVPGENGTLLRTRRGLFTTREVDREDARLRGVQLTEPLFWRAVGVSDTNVITTGLSIWSMSAPATVLPRGPSSVARRVAGDVLAAPRNPLEVELVRHPRAALRRRLVWATWLNVVLAAGALGGAAAGWFSPTGGLVGSATGWVLSYAGAVLAYRALGHALTPPYLVTRSGLVSRATTVLHTSAVSTVVLRESVFQRRLRLRTVSVMTSAGFGGYDLPDLDADDAVRFAADVTDGLLEPFLVRSANADS